MVIHDSSAGISLNGMLVQVSRESLAVHSLIAIELGMESASSTRCDDDEVGRDEGVAWLLACAPSHDLPDADNTTL